MEDVDSKQPATDGEGQREGSRMDVVASITFHDLSYEVTQRKCFKRLPNRTILNSVNGEMRRGLNAIMGPTGSGKTTLLDLLADRKDKSGKSGKVLVNGQRRQPNYKNMVGYVVQDDVVMGTLSVRENLQFSAALRLPSHMTWQQRRDRVERVIEILNLQKCASTKVGTEFLRGVSGGERKRTNIGMELIIEPQVLFLDEPTTGLDAYTAVSVVQLLKDLSSSDNRVIILSIHQPRYSIFKLFDNLSLLSQGDMVYHGQAACALDYFERLGFACEEHENPADFFLDLINRLERESKQATLEAVNCQLEGGEGGEVTISESQGGVVALVDSYKASPEYRTLRENINPILKNMREEEKEKGVRGYVRRKFGHQTFATSFIWQILIVTLRSAVNLLRSPTTSIFQLLITSFLAVVIGLIYWQLDTHPNGFTDRIGVFFFIITNQSFGSLSAIQLFIEQKALFIHENASGYYRVSAFFIAKLLTDLLPLRLLPNTVFALITYFMIGFQVVVSKFFIYWLVIQLVNLTAVSLAFFISAGVRNAAVANLLIVLPFIVNVLFGGLLIALDSLPEWIGWFKYLSFMRYAIEAFAINEMDGLTFEGPCQIEQVFPDDGSCNVTNTTTLGSGMFPAPTTTTSCTPNCVFDGLAQLSQLGYETDVLWWDVFALVVFSSVFLTLAYLVLLLVKKEK